ncbi:PTS mannose transporter subunit IIA [Virgibacillus pantothenticus]|uniref:PTS mannose transporter subunit IIA n=1 Tax=Virgibacillus pantothenticus TaxID=1473 RepID=A0A0L0QLK6_VIRPA|nr:MULTISPECIES: PTS mannose transporter subunit IIA [Virgibacillus]API93108.1 PTS mannose transporter subunit IIA [Virgibacillus sp. 6R]KNE19404.1 PTS mannose transporter subunit IIA [Virgibacillus pantothenticus]MBS7428856.1 PTS mannose transporter subunit IIA [Virgibacillus sp. 19R1-5]MBU8568437.1 PTS mannose transporter subunit IIA [Virgibacillus pantothenticus]MBU8602435.1 PTS mannose transporter subunit IIA [Virgibacillus pantothenticus]
MERILVLASHGEFASGILSSLELICGKKNNIVTLNAYLTANYDLATEVEKLMKENQSNELIVITDIFGGSVNNEFLKYIHTPNFYLASGMNLPWLIEIVTHFATAESIPQLIKSSLSNSKEMLQFCNETIQVEKEEEDF